jgi:hypothetical protein
MEERIMIYRFESNEAFYANAASPAEVLSFEWDTDTGIPKQLDWAHPTPYFLHTDPGRITEEGPSGTSYYDVDLQITARGFEDTPYPLKGKLIIKDQLPKVTFAAVLKQNSSAWLVADGTLIER